MWKYNNTDELYHYGVIGMHWGVRKAANDYYKSGEKYGKYLKNVDKRNKYIAKRFVKDQNTTDENRKAKDMKKTINKVRKYETKGKKYFNDMKLYQKKAHDVIKKYGIKSKITRKFVSDNFDSGVVSGYAKNKYSNLLGYPASALGIALGGSSFPYSIINGTIGGTIGATGGSLLLDYPKAERELKEKYKYKFGPSKIHKNRL